MATQNRNTLKEYFNAGDRPTEIQFVDLIDSSTHKTEDKASLTEAQAGTDNNKFITAQGAKKAAETFAPVKTVNSIAPVSGNIAINIGGGLSVGSIEFGVEKFFTTENSTTKIFHIKLPYNIVSKNGMYHIKAEGYAYQEGGEIIDIVWVGYCYIVNNVLLNKRAHVNRSTAITAGQYVGSDDFIYLWFKVPNTYYCTFRLDSMRVGNGIHIKPGDLDIVMSDQAEL